MVKKKDSKKKPEVPMLKLVTEKDIANDFSVKAYKKFDKMIKSIILFGSQTKHTSRHNQQPF